MGPKILYVSNSAIVCNVGRLYMRCDWPALLILVVGPLMVCRPLGLFIIYAMWGEQILSHMCLLTVCFVFLLRRRAFDEIKELSVQRLQHCVDSFRLDRSCELHAHNRLNILEPACFKSSCLCEGTSACCL